MNMNMIMKIINMDFLMSRIDRYLDKPGNMVVETVYQVDKFLYNRDEVLFWVDYPLIYEYERDFAVSSDEKRDKARRKLLSVLVLSYQPDDVHCAVAILQDSLLHATTPKQKRQAMYLLAVGYYRIGNYSKSMGYVAGCLEIKPQWYRAMVVENLVQGRIQEERGYNLLIASAMTIGLVTGLLPFATLFLDPTWVIEALTFKFLTKDGVKKVVTATLPDISNPMQMNEEMYLLAHRYFIRGNFEDTSRCSYLIDRCLEIAPDWKPAMTLKRRIKYARVKAYIGERILEGIGYAVVSLSTLSVLRWAFD